jgi:hypothetical protein
VRLLVPRRRSSSIPLRPCSLQTSWFNTSGLPTLLSPSRSIESSIWWPIGTSSFPVRASSDSVLELTDLPSLFFLSSWEWDDQTLHPSSSFQRTIHFGKDTDLVGIRAQLRLFLPTPPVLYFLADPSLGFARRLFRFDGSILKIIVPRNPPITFRRPESFPYPPLTSMQASRPASSNFLRSASFCPSPPILQPILPLDTIALNKTKRQDGRLGGADAMSWPRRRSETDDDVLQPSGGSHGKAVDGSACPS